MEDRKKVANDAFNLIERIGQDFFMDAPIPVEKKLVSLNYIFQEFLEIEDYEKCAVLRDMIRKIEEHGKG